MSVKSTIYKNNTLVLIQVVNSISNNFVKNVALILITMFLSTVSEIKYSPNWLKVMSKYRKNIR